MDDPFIYGLLIILLFFFLLLKYAFISVNHLQLELDKKKGVSHSRVLNYIGRNIPEFLVSVNISYFITFAALILLLLTGIPQLLQPLNGKLYYFAFFGIIILATFSVITILTFGEYFANRIIYIFSYPLVILHLLTLPITKIILLFYKNPANLFFEDNTNDAEKKFDKKDLGKLVSDRQQHTNNGEEINPEIKLFQNALEFSELKARECMVPRTELVAIEINDLQESLRERFIQSGHSKILVYKESTDNIIGYVKSKSLFSTKPKLESSIKKLPIFPESMNINKLLKYFNRMGQNMALIVDEFGGTSGIVTLEDILEEIFGDIKDEHDSEDLYEKKLSDTSYVFSGRLEIDYLNEKYNLSIPEDDDYETIAGYILSRTENIPKQNDIISIEDFVFKIIKVSNTRVELVKLEIENE